MRVPLRAWLLEASLDLKKVQGLFPDHVACGGDSVLLKLENDGVHRICVTSFGALVFWPFDEELARRTARRIQEQAGNPSLEEAVEDRLVVVTGQGETKVLFNEIWLAGEATPDHVCVISGLLAQSVALESMELKVDEALDQFQTYVRDVRERGRVRLSTRKVLQSIGFAMQTRQAVLNDLALFDRPDITWEREDIEQLHRWLHEHFELGDRVRSIGRKLDFLADNTSLLMDVLSTRKFLRLEWAIVILIALELLVFGYWEAMR